MKKSVSIILLAVSVMLFSCTKETKNESASATHKVVFNAVSPESKAAFGAKVGTTYPVLWTVNDEAPAVTCNYAASFVQASDFELSDGNTKATFSSSISLGALSSPYTFVAVSPYTSLKSVATAAKRLNVEIPSGQTPTSSSPDESAIVLFAKSIEYADAPDYVDLSFEHITGYFHLVFTGLSLGVGETVQAVNITSDLDIAGRMFFFPEDGSTSSNAMVKTISVTTDDVSDVWVGLAPNDFSNETLSFKIVTNEYVYSKSITLPSDRELGRGEVKKLTINMSDASSTEAVEYTMVTSASQLNVNDEVIVVSSKYDYALSTTQNGNNRGYTGVTKTGSSIYSPSDAVQIITLVDGYVPGEYALQVGTGNYLRFVSGGNYLRTGTEIDANASWDIAVGNPGYERDGETPDNISLIQETTDSRFIFYNTTGLFSAYTRDQFTGSVGFVRLYRKNVAADSSPRFKATMPADGSVISSAAVDLPVYIFGNVAWTASVSPATATLSLTSGTGNSILTLTVPANTSGAPIDYTVTVSTGASVAPNSYELKFTQDRAWAANEVVWSEGWTGAANQQTPSSYFSGTGTYCPYRADDLAYAQSSGTQIYNSENTTSVFYTKDEYTAHYNSMYDPSFENLLIKSNGYWTVSGIPVPKGVTKATLYYYLNSIDSDGTLYTATTESTGVTLSNRQGGGTVKYYTCYDRTTLTKKYYENTYDVTFDSTAGNTFTLKFNNTNASANVRIDDIKLVVTTVE